MNNLGKNFGDSNIQKNRDWRTYGDSLTINAGASATRNFLVEAEADFYALKFQYFAVLDTLAAITLNTQQLPLIRVQISDQGSGLALFQNPVALPLIAGDGRLPAIIPLKEGRKFAANSGINFTFTNYSAATNYVLDFALVGVKVWR